jgi:hypothetical protein
MKSVCLLLLHRNIFAQKPRIVKRFAVKQAPFILPNVLAVYAVLPASAANKRTVNGCEGSRTRYAKRGRTLFVHKYLSSFSEEQKAALSV